MSVKLKLPARRREIDLKTSLWRACLNFTAFLFYTKYKVVGVVDAIKFCCSCCCWNYRGNAAVWGIYKLMYIFYECTFSVNLTNRNDYEWFQPKSFCPLSMLNYEFSYEIDNVDVYQEKDLFSRTSTYVILLSWICVSYWYNVAVSSLVFRIQPRMQTIRQRCRVFRQQQHSLILMFTHFLFVSLILYIHFTLFVCDADAEADVVAY